MFDDLDDASPIRVPDDALERSKTDGHARLRRRQVLFAAAAAVAILAIAVPLVSRGGGPDTTVGFTDDPAPTSTVSSETTSVTAPSECGDGNAPSCAAATTTPKVDDLVPTGLFARLDESGAYSAVVSRFDGSERRVVARDDSSFIVKGVTWSPDHSRLAVSFGTAVDAQSQRYVSPTIRIDVFDAASGRTNPLVRFTDKTSIKAWEWSPNSSSIVLVTGARDGEASALDVVDVDTTRRTNVATGRSILSPRWSPDGSAIAYGDGSSPRKLLSIGATGGEPRQLASSVGEDWQWSPTGASLAYSTSVLQGDAPMHVVNGDGTADHPLSDPNDGVDTVDTGPDWSPDGSHVLFARTPRGDGAASSIVVDPAGTAPRRFSERIPSHQDRSNWTPDSRAVVLIRIGFSEARLTRVDGSGELVLTDGVLSATSLSPDGRALASASQGGEVSATVLADGKRSVVASNSDNFLEWSPDGSTLVTRTVQSDGSQNYTAYRIDGRRNWKFHD